MILKIFLLVFCIILISLLLYFLVRVFIPAVSKQTGMDDDIILSRFEWKFDKLSNRSGASEITRKAFVDSSGKVNLQKWFPKNYFNSLDCRTIAAILKADSEASFSCLGRGDCIEQCSQEALFIDKDGAEVSDLCTGCGKCVDVCPKKIIKLIDLKTKKPVDQEELNSGKKITWNIKVGFKIWRTCYKIVRKK